MKKILLYLTVLTFIISCKVDSGKKEDPRQNKIDTNSEKEVDTSNEISLEKTFEDLLQGDANSEGLSEILTSKNLPDSTNKQLTMDLFFSLLEAGGMQRVDIDTLYTMFLRKDRKGAQKIMAKYGTVVGPYANMDELFDDLEKISEGSGVDMEAFRGMMSKEHLEQNLSHIETEEEKQAEQKAAKAIGMPEPSYIEEKLFSTGFYGEKERKAVLAKLASSSKEDADGILADHFEVTKEEVALLKKLPANKKLTTQEQAQAQLDKPIPDEIETYLKNGKPSHKFKAIIDKERLKRKDFGAERFIKSARDKRAAFYKENPGWYAGENTRGEVYSDSRGNLVYLPLGKLSFADEVISHYEGVGGQGKYSTGALGVPDYVDEGTVGQAKSTLCNLGMKGVLTVKFTNNAIANVNGADIYIFEIGEIEATNLEISKDGKHWIDVGRIRGGTAEVDIAPFVKTGESFSFLRLTDLESSSALPGADIDAIAAIGGALRLSLSSEVLFATGKHELKEKGIKAIKELASQISMVEKAIVTVEGHTDDVGSDQNNLELSKKRAASVAVQLKKVIANAQFKWKEIGHGESKPIAPNDNDKNRAKNRRVEILVTPY